MMNKIIVASIIAIFLAGCSLLETRVEYRDKYIPIYTVPAPPEITMPELPIHNPRFSSVAFLNAQDNIGEIAQAYVVSMKLLLNYATAQEEILNTYRELSQRDFANEPILRSMEIGEDMKPVAFGSSRDSGGSESQIALEVYARREFASIVNKYESNKEEILRDEITRTP